MTILIYCPEARAREAICHYLIEVGSHHILFAETEQLTVTITLHNEINLLLLHDPPNVRSLIDLKDFLRQTRRHLRVRILPSQKDLLMEGWRDVVSEALKPIKPRHRAALRTHPRFQWKPDD